MGKLFRIVGPDGTQIIVQVPEFAIPILPAWSADTVQTLGMLVAQKQLGQSWVGLLHTGQRSKNGQPLMAVVPLDPHCYAMLDRINEPPAGLVGV